jgi:hypothetical protein
MQAIPSDILIMIFTFTEPSIVSRSMALVNKKWKECSDSELLWKAFCHRYGVVKQREERFGKAGVMTWKEIFKRGKEIV